MENKYSIVVNQDSITNGGDRYALIEDGKRIITADSPKHLLAYIGLRTKRRGITV